MACIQPTYLYQLTSPGGKSYVGVTTKSLNRRISAHLCNDHAIGRALRKYGVENFKVEVLVIGPENYIYGLETRAIETFDTMVPNGYNILGGGQGGSHTEETKRKISESHVGVRPSLETRQKLSEVHRGHRHSEATRRKMSEAQKRRWTKVSKRERKLSEEHRQKLSEAGKKRICSVVTRQRLSKATRSSWAKGGIRRWRV